FGGNVPSISGFQAVDPELEKHNNGLMVPTIKTKSSEISGVNEELKIDLFGNTWKKNRTVGAIQFPFETVKNLPLNEDNVGARYIE
ncbi:MAG: hypothetical protein ACLFQA_10240, partial [Bacteroidales bacterium]